jgi:DNA primase
MDDVEEIKSRIDIVQLIGEHVKLQKAGQNWKGRCPFHNEKSPSFMVNQDRQFYYCFGCSQGGDIFTFLQKIENIEFPEALRILAKKAGVNLKKFDERASNQKTRLLDLLSTAAGFWHKTLYSPAGKSALAYLTDRGLDKTTIENFRLGYAVESWDNLLKFLKSQKYTETEIFQAGLTVKKEQASSYYDRFRDRAMFPITDIYGNVVGFTGRTMKKDDNAKYVNTPETDIYHKGKILFGLDKAKQEIKKKNFVVVVEGNMDVISSHRVGITNVVAVSGTALTPDQINLLKRFTTNVCFCFDMDAAGQNAAKRSIDLALENDLNIKIVQVLFGKDPDDCVRKNPQDWVKSIEQAKSIMQFYFDDVFSKYDVNNIDQKKLAAKELLTEINKLPDAIEKDHWIKQLAGKLNVNDNLLREALPSTKNVKQTKPIADKKTLTPKKEPLITSKKDYFEEMILSFALYSPENLKFIINRLSPEMFSEPRQTLYKQLIILYNNNNQTDKQAVSDALSKNKDLELHQSYLNSLYVLVDNEFSGLSSNELQKEFLRLVEDLERLIVNEQIAAIDKLIMTQDGASDKKIIEELYKKRQFLIQTKNKQST